MNINLKFIKNQIDLDLLSVRKNKDSKVDKVSVNTMLSLRFKLISFMNSAHDLIFNQVNKT
jgi:hypothetical protein